MGGLIINFKFYVLIFIPYLLLPSCLHQQIKAKLTINESDSSYFVYNGIINEALIKKDSGKYTESVILFDSAFATKSVDPYIFYLAFESAVKAKDSIRALNYLIQGTTIGLKINDYSTDSKNIFFKNSLGNYFLKIKDSLNLIYISKIDTIFRNNLYELYIRDQSLRDTSVLTRIQDSLNFKNLIILSHEKCFPTYYSSGDGLNYATTILWHNKTDFKTSILWKEMIPIIQDEINVGKLDPIFLSYFE